MTARQLRGLAARNAKFDDIQIINGALEQDGKRVAAHLQKMRDCEAAVYEKSGHDLRKIDEFRISLSQTLAEVKAKCRGEGFKAFQDKWCPDLQRSSIYELLRIGRGVLTLEQARAAAAKRKRKQRERELSVTSANVTDNVGADGKARKKPIHWQQRVHPSVAYPAAVNGVTARTVIEERQSAEQPTDDAQSSAEKRKAEYSDDDVSKKATAERKLAIDTHWPKMKATERTEITAYLLGKTKVVPA
jgi:hypothetical protein